MRKLSTSVLNKMIAGSLSSFEVDFLIVVGQRQEDSGWIRGVYYKDLAEELGCSVQQFYNVLKSLQEKGIIQYEKASYYDYDLLILDNDFTEGKAVYKKGYISLDKGIFNKEFSKMKAGSKLLALELIRRAGIQGEKIEKNCLRFKKSTLYRVFGSLLQVTKRVLHYYLNELRVFFSIGIKEGIYYITPKIETRTKKSRYDSNADSDQKILNKNEVKTFCRRNRINTDSYSPAALDDTAELLTQYRSKCRELKLGEDGQGVVELIRSCILRSVDKKQITYVASERRLEPKLIHMLFRKRLKEIEEKLYHPLAIPEIE